jgi:hypothetical protein
MAWRKGADVDQELWPAEAFGGVSDEQFWDDMAADKPLATTARTAQPDGAARRRRPNAGPLPELRPGDNRTEMRPVRAAAQPSPNATQPSPNATQPSPNATQPVRAAYQGAGMDEDPLTSPAYSLRPKARSHQLSRRSDLTRAQYEAATSQDTQTFSLAEAQAAAGGYPGGVPPFRQFDQPARGNGPARSDSPRADPLAPNGYRTDPLRSGPYAPGAPYGSYAANPYPPQPRGGPSQPGNAVNTPPYGEAYGYGDTAGHASPVGDPQRGNGGRSPGRAGGDGSVRSHQVYPSADGYRGPQYPREHGRR